MTAPLMYYYADAPLGRPKIRSSWPAAIYTLVPLGILLGLVALVNVPAAGVLYVISVLVLSFWRPHLALMLAFALAPFVEDIIGDPVHISLGELTLALCVPAFLITGLKNLRFPAFLFFTLLYLAACVISCIINVDKQAVVPMAQTFLYLVVTVLVFSSLLRNPQQLVFILEGSLVVIVFLAILTYYPPIASRLAISKNSLGASMSTATVIAIECWFAAYKSRTRRRILFGVVLFLAVTLLYTLSRGAWLGAIAGVFVIMALRRQFKLFGMLIAILAPLLLILFFLLPEDRQNYAIGFDTDRGNIEARVITIDYTLSLFRHSPIYGVGISLRKVIDATNIVCVSLAESGILGLGTFALMHFGVLRSAWKTQKMIPRSDLLYSPVALGGALVIARLTHGLVDHYWSRGPILQAWAAAGMCTAVYFHMRKRRLNADKQRKAVQKKRPEAPPFGGPLDFLGPQPTPTGIDKF